MRFVRADGRVGRQEAAKQEANPPLLFFAFPVSGPSRWRRFSPTSKSSFFFFSFFFFYSDDISRSGITCPATWVLPFSTGRPYVSHDWQICSGTLAFIPAPPPPQPAPLNSYTQHTPNSRRLLDGLFQFKQHPFIPLSIKKKRTEAEQQWG
jgi:hypothetical protein